jgi:ribosomal protein S27AE
MARPQSDKVDYFSHDCDASGRKTLAIMKGEFGLAGVGFWWALLEYLGHSERHVYDGRDDTDLEFMLRQLGTDVVSGTKMLDKLAFLGAIDKVLWDHHVVWSQNFVDRLADVYKKRGRSLPSKPSFCDGNCSHSHTTGGITVAETPNQESVVNPEKSLKTWCRSATNKAVEKGVIKRKPCEVCGAIEVEAHHEDYNDPCKVTWLCGKHHKIADAKLLLAQNVSVTEMPQSIVKDSIVNNTTPSKEGARKKPTNNKKDATVKEIFLEMQEYYGFPEKIKVDPIPSYGKEGQAIKRMLTRGFTREAIVECWKGKVSQRGGEFISMTWVNEDIGKPEKQRGGARRLSTDEEIAASIKEATTWHGDK